VPRYNNKAAAAARAAWCGMRRTRIPFHVTHFVFDRRSFQLYQEVRECARYFGCLEKNATTLLLQNVSSVLEIESSLLRVYAFCHGHGLFLQFFGFFRSVEDLFTSAYNTGSQAVKQEASL
jgi:hypothetical protein